MSFLSSIVVEGELRLEYRTRGKIYINFRIPDSAGMTSENIGGALILEYGYFVAGLTFLVFLC